MGFALVREKMERIDMPEQLEQIEAVIFDLDGSLVDSMWIWRDIDIEFLAARGLELPDDFQRAIEGMSFTETAVYSRERFGLSESVEELKAIWNQMAMDKYSCEVPFKPGALRFLKYCKSRGIRMGIATSNSRELVAAVDGALKLSDYIEQVVTSCEVPKGKPAPDVYLEAARRLAVQPARCLVFEDVPAGIRAGKNAGMQVCAVEDAFSGDLLEEKRRLADYYITSYQEILEGTAEHLPKKDVMP